MCAGRVVIDCACGDGSGTETYANARASHVHAFDISPDAVESTRRRGLDNVTATAADALSLPLPDRAADLYVSYETIEHVDDQRRMVAEIHRVLRPGGILVLSTPNRPVYSPGHGPAAKPWNPFHVRELDALELGELLRPCFDRIEWFGQTSSRPLVVQALGALGRLVPFNLAVRLRQAAKLRWLIHDKPGRDQVLPLGDERVTETLVVVATRARD